MPHPLPARIRNVAARAALLYALFAGLVVLTGDRLRAWWTIGDAEYARLLIHLGWVFVAITTGLLYWGLRRHVAYLRRESDARRETAAALERSEERFRTFVDQAGDACFLHDVDGRILDVNRHACSQSGYARDELLRMRMADIADEAEARDLAKRWREAKSGTSETLETRHRCKDGSVLDIELRLGCFEAHGQRRFLALARDITDSRRGEAMSEGYRRILEMIAMGADFRETLDELLRSIEAQESAMLCSIMLMDADGKHLRTGAAPSLPRDYFEALDGLQIGPDVGSCGTAAHRRERVIVEDIAGDPLWSAGRAAALKHGLAACWSTPFFGSDRDVLGTFAIYYREARGPTARELDLVDWATHAAVICVSRLRVAQALGEAQRRLQSALEIGGIGTFVVDLERNETIWDEPLVRIYGRRWRREDGAQLEPFLAIVHPDDRERVRCDVSRAISEPEGQPSEFRVVHPDGRVRWVATTARAECGADGRPARLIGATVDITARKSAEENLRQAQKIEAIGQLSGGIAHDFNNILTVIQAGVSFIELEPALPRPVRDFVAEIKGAASRAANLTRQLLTFSRRQAMQLRYIELNEAVTNMSRMLQRVLGEHIHMELRLAPQDLGVLGDSGMIEQVVMNLAVNARDAMPGGGHLLIGTGIKEFDGELPNQRHGTFACLEVVDTGAGIDDAALPHIFEPFFTTKEPGRGTGLGLATVSGIVEQHGGWVDVHTEQGRGTRFVVHFPVVSRRDMERARRSSLVQRSEGSETVLLVEDEAVVRALVRNLLARSGYQVLEAASGPRAVELWNGAGREIDLLITDVIMPEGMNGAELANRLRQDRPDLRVIFTSGYSPETIRQVESMEGTTFLSKPFDLDHLTAAVRAVLDHPVMEGGAGAEFVMRR